MAEHFPRACESTLKWCNACSRLTVHAVSGGRIDRCIEHQIEGESKKQKEAREKREREAANPKLF